MSTYEVLTLLILFGTFLVALRPQLVGDAYVDRMQIQSRRWETGHIDSNYDERSPPVSVTGSDRT